MLKYDKYAKTKYAHICKHTICINMHKLENMDKYAKPDMHRYTFSK